MTRTALLALLALAACTSATPERVLRAESDDSRAAEPLCGRMAEDFGLTVTGGDVLSGREWSTSLADTFLSARGVSFQFVVRDDDPAEACETRANGVVCQVVGPATLEIGSNAGRAAYRVAAGQSARVASEGAVLLCREAPG